VEPPDPGQAGTLDDLVHRLRLLKVWAGDPSYASIKDRVNAEWAAAGRPAAELARKTTVVDCFRTGRRRLNTDLVLAVVHALHPEVGYVSQWRQALRVIGGETRAAAQVRVQDSLPRDLARFTGRGDELDQLRQFLRTSRRHGGAVVISAIEGMAGVGKTQLAIHAGHLLTRELPFDHVLFVNLRGFHPDPAQPPADPAAVLDGFLRLLGVPGHQIPHDLPARTSAYRDRVAGTTTLVVLDNAATEDQVRPLLPDSPGCLTLITSRRSLTGLAATTRLAVDVFTAEEARRFLGQAAPDIPVGADPTAHTRIAARCGHLPLALELIAGHLRATPRWTLTDHADRLDERHRTRRLDTGVELALDLSYQHLPADRRRLLRLLALHPGQEVDLHAAAALAGTDLLATGTHLRHLCDDHLLQQPTPGRYTFHDLVRAYAINRADDETPPAERRTALTRLFDYYLATAAAAMDTLHPAEVHLRPRVPPVVTPTPALTEADVARTWLDTERPNLVAAAVHTAAHGWSAHTIRLSTVLFRYLDGGHFADALAIHGHAHRAAEQAGDPTGQAHASLGLGAAHMQMGNYTATAHHLELALTLFRRTGDHGGQARVLNNLGRVEQRLSRYERAIDRYQQAQALHRQTGDLAGQARALYNRGNVEVLLGRFHQAADLEQQALALFQRAGDRTGEASALNTLGEAEVRLGRIDSAADHLQQALALCRELGHRDGEAWTLEVLGALHARAGQRALAAEYHQQALAIFRDVGGRVGECWVLNDLGDAARADCRAADAVTHHTAAHTIATDTGDRDQQARAQFGLGRAHHLLGDAAQAREHYRHALTLYTDLGMPEADELGALLTTVDGGPGESRSSDHLK
jgi:tetratricopeptide (TPR) repeat protein